MNAKPKPSTPKSVRRSFELLKMLVITGIDDGPGLSADELSSRFHIGDRQVRRIIHWLQDLGIPVIRQSSTADNRLRWTIKPDKLSRWMNDRHTH